MKCKQSHSDLNLACWVYFLLHVPPHKTNIIYKHLPNSLRTASINELAYKSKSDISCSCQLNRYNSSSRFGLSNIEACWQLTNSLFIYLSANIMYQLMTSFLEAILVECFQSGVVNSLRYKLLKAAWMVLSYIKK